MDIQFMLRHGVYTLKTWAQEPTVVAIVIALLTISVATRLTTGSAQTREKDAWIPSAASYSIPYFGHLPQLSWKLDGFLDGMRERYPQGIFSLRLMGRTATVVHSPSLTTALLNKPQAVADEKWLSERLIVSNFQMPKPKTGSVWDTYAPIHALYSKHLSAGEGLNELVNATAQSLKASVADFVTFNSYPSDQSGWEQLAEADVVESSEGKQFMEASLFEMTNNFVAQTSIPALMGTDFLTNFPEFTQLLWAYDAAFVPIAMGMPAVLPWPRLQRGKVAARQILNCLYEFHEAMDKELEGQDPGARWSDLHNVSTLVRSRVELYREKGLDIHTRCANEFSLLWAANANSDPLVFWMIFEICRDPELMEQIREEIAPYVQAVQPRNEFGLGVWIPPRVETLDVDGLVNGCPLLKSAYVETMRMYTGTVTVKWMLQDATIKDRDSGEEYVLKKDTYAVAAHEMHQMDPKAFPSPKEWQGTRHVKENTGEDGKVVKTADLGSLRPYGGGEAMCKGRAFAMRQIMMYTAVLLTMYEIKPPEGKSWTVPKTVKQGAIKHPASKVQAWFKRRDLPYEKDPRQAARAD